jgi:hypothetical protein
MPSKEETADAEKKAAKKAAKKADEKAAKKAEEKAAKKAEEKAADDSDAKEGDVKAKKGKGTKKEKAATSDGAKEAESRDSRVESCRAVDERTTKKAMDITNAEYSIRASKLQALDVEATTRRLESVKAAYLAKVGGMAAAEFIIHAQLNENLRYQQQIASAKQEAGKNLQKCLVFAQEMQALIALLGTKKTKAEAFNNAFCALSVAQIALGTAATGLGITLIVVTCGAATPVVAGAAIAMYTSGTVIGSTSLGVGVVSSGVKVGRDATTKTKKAKKGAKDEVVSNVGENGLEIGAAFLAPELAVLGGGSAVAAGTSVLGVGVFAGAFAAMQGAFALQDSMTFDSGQLYWTIKEDWKSHRENMARMISAFARDDNPCVADWKARNSFIFDQVFALLRDNQTKLFQLQAKYE